MNRHPLCRKGCLRGSQLGDRCDSVCDLQDQSDTELSIARELNALEAEQLSQEWNEK